MLLSGGREGDREGGETGKLVSEAGDTALQRGGCRAVGGVRCQLCMSVCRGRRLGARRVRQLRRTCPAVGWNEGSSHDTPTLFTG